MKKVINLLFFLMICAAIQAQCYEPNLQKADAEYSKGNYSSAYEYYRRASGCPDASRFENGKKAKQGIKKCLPTIRIEGIRKIEGHCPTDTVSYNGGRKTYKVIFKNAKDWEISPIGRDSSWIRIVEQNHKNGTFTIEYMGNKKSDSRRSSNIGIHLIGGVEYESTHFQLFQEGNTSLLVNGKNTQSIDAGYRGGEHTFDITSEMEWNCQVKVSDTLWLKSNKSKLSNNANNGKLNIQIKDNVNSPRRTGYVIVSAGEIQCTVTVNQQADPAYDESSWADMAYMDIKDLVFYNGFDWSSSMGNNLYAKNITFLTPCILYEGKASNKETIIDTLYVKIYKNGRLSRNEKTSPPGYSYSVINYTIRSDGELNKLTMSGWGSEDATTYDYGTCRCEIWYKGRMLISKEVKITYGNAPKITSVDFIKTDAKGRNIGDYGNGFEVEDLEYIKPRIHFDNPGGDLKSKHFNMIVTDPDGNKVRTFVIYKDGKETTIDSIRYRNMVELMKSGKDQTAEMIPWKTQSLKTKLGTWKFELHYGTDFKVAESSFIIYSKNNYLKLNGEVSTELPISAFAGCNMIKLETTSRTNKYKISVAPEDNKPSSRWDNMDYKTTVLFEHSHSGDTMILSKVDGHYTEPCVRIEMATDTSFVIRWLRQESPKKDANNKRYTITVSNDAGFAEMILYIPADSVTALQNRKQKKLPISVKNEVLEMVYVEGGDFVMGSTSDSPTQYAPKAHIRHVNGYYISTYPVTQKLWKAVMGTQPAAGWSRKLGKGDDYVAYNITFEEAATFVKKLNEITGMKFAIPLEEEFEYVFRGGKLAKKWKYDYASSPVYTKSAIGKYGYEYINTGTVRLYSEPNVRYSIGKDMTIHVLRLVLHL